MSLFDENARTFLAKSLTARMSTVDVEGYPHTVPVWYMLDGDDIVIMGTRTTKKVAHMRRDPKGSVCIGGDSGDGAGYLIKGEWRIEEDPGKHWQITITRHYEPPDKAEKDLADWADLDIIVMRLKPTRVIKVA
jgi:PPOX class probable F420-dependent enzyme